MTPFPSNTPAHGALFRHTDGGLYRFLTAARHTDDTAPLYLYEHLWPFPAQEPWARPAEQWASRFKPITQAELDVAMSGDRAQAQAVITAAKAARRVREGGKQTSPSAAIPKTNTSA